MKVTERGRASQVGERSDRLRQKTVPTVDLSVIENISVDPQVDALVAEREELCDLQEVAREVLKPHEYAIVRLVELGVRRAVVANRLGLSLASMPLKVCIRGESWVAVIVNGPTQRLRERAGLFFCQVEHHTWHIRSLTKAGHPAHGNWKGR